MIEYGERSRIHEEVTKIYLRFRKFGQVKNNSDCPKVTMENKMLDILLKIIE